MFEDEVEVVKIEDCQYSISGIIGEGGAGIVYLAMNNKKQKYALKMIRNYTKNTHLKESVDSQIKIQKMFRHQKYVINCYGETVIGKDIYILFQLGECSLRNKIQMNQLIQHEYIKMLIDVSNGIRSIHNKKMMHRDIKPQNIIYRSGMYKITDFGTTLAGQKTSEMAGTCLYWAPQILFDQSEQYTQAIDIWSFGVVAFEAYFRIHPFYYDKLETSHKKAIQILKANIQTLTKPCFNFERLIKHLKSKGLLTEAQFITNKIKNAIPQLISTFQGFFVRTPSKRLQIDLLVALFQSLQNCAIKKASEVKQSRTKHKQLPVDVQFFVKALNFCYELNHNYPYAKHQQVQFCLQLGLRFLSMRNYGGQHWIQYQHKQKIKKIKQPTKAHFEDIRTQLSEYFFYLKQAKQLQFYDKLSLLRIYIIMCSCWNRIFQKMNTVCKRLQVITGLQIKNLNDFSQIIPTLTERQLSSIQNYIISDFYR